MINAISTPQDLAQFLLEMSGRVLFEAIENRTLDAYWDALAGVMKVDGPKVDASNPWRDLALIFDKALYYE